MLGTLLILLSLYFYFYFVKTLDLILLACLRQGAILPQKGLVKFYAYYASHNLS